MTDDLRIVAEVARAKRVATARYKIRMYLDEWVDALLRRSPPARPESAPTEMDTRAAAESRVGF